MSIIHEEYWINYHFIEQITMPQVESEYYEQRLSIYQIIGQVSTLRGASFPAMSQDSSVCCMCVFAELAMYLCYHPLFPSASQVRIDIQATFPPKFNLGVALNFNGLIRIW